MLSKISQTRKDKHRFYSYEVSKVVKIIRTEGRVVVGKGWRQGSGLTSNGERVSVLQTEGSVDLSHHSGKVVNTPDLYT